MIPGDRLVRLKLGEWVLTREAIKRLGMLLLLSGIGSKNPVNTPGGIVQHFGPFKAVP